MVAGLQLVVRQRDAAADEFLEQDDVRHGFAFGEHRPEIFGEHLGDRGSEVRRLPRGFEQILKTPADAGASSH